MIYIFHENYVLELENLISHDFKGTLRKVFSTFGKFLKLLLHSICIDENKLLSQFG